MARQEFSEGGFIGKVGQLVGANWKKIRYIRTYVIPANPKTPKQVAVRNVFAEAVKLSQQAMNFNGHQGIWDNPNRTEWQLRMSQCLRDLQSGLTPEQSIPYYPHGYNPSRHIQVLSCVVNGFTLTITVDNIPQALRVFQYEVLMTAHWSDDRGVQKSIGVTSKLPVTGNIIIATFDNPSFLEGWTVQISGDLNDSSLPAGWFLDFPIFSVPGYPIANPSKVMTVVSTSLVDNVLTVVLNDIPNPFKPYKFDLKVTAHFINDIDVEITMTISRILGETENSLTYTFTDIVPSKAWAVMVEGLANDPTLPVGWTLTFPNTQVTGTPVENPSQTVTIISSSVDGVNISATFSEIPDFYRGKGFNFATYARWQPQGTGETLKNVIITLPMEGNSVTFSYPDAKPEPAWEMSFLGYSSDSSLPSIWRLDFNRVMIDGTPLPKIGGRIIMSSITWNNGVLTAIAPAFDEYFRGRNWQIFIRANWNDTPGQTSIKVIETVVPLTGQAFVADFGNARFDEYKYAMCNGTLNDDTVPSIWTMQWWETEIEGFPKINPSKAMAVTQCQGVDDEVWVVTDGIPEYFRGFSYRFTIRAYFNDAPSSERTLNFDTVLPMTGNKILLSGMNPTIWHENAAYVKGLLNDSRTPVGWFLTFPETSIEGL